MKKLVLFEFHLLGDAVMSLPFLRAAQTRYDVFVCCSAPAAKVYELVLPPERIFRTELPSFLRGSAPARAAFRQAREGIRRLQAEVGVTVWADVRVHLLMRSLGLTERVGFEMNEQNYYAHNLGWRRRNLRIGQAMQSVAKLRGRPPLTTALQRRDYQQHHMLDWAQLGEALGVTPDSTTPWLDPAAWKIHLPAKAQDFFTQNHGRKIWLLHPGAGKECKRWPHFQELVTSFFAPAQLPLIILEDPTVPPIQPAHENCLLWPMSSLSDFIALVARADFILCNDSAASHIGAALRKHVVALFSSSSAQWFGPNSERTLIESFNCPYRPCLDKCLQPRYLCLDDLPLEKVAGRLTSLL